MGYSLSVDDHNFAEEVIKKSYEKPILVDFFAVWCGPCQMLKPILEKVAQEYDCVVAKLNVDENPAIAREYEIEGIPDVRLFKNGEIIDGFVGVLPEPSLKQFLANHQITSEIDQALEAIASIDLAASPEATTQLCDQLLQKFPENRLILIAIAKIFLRLGKLSAAQKILAPIQEDEKEYFNQAQALKALLRFTQAATNTDPQTHLDQLFTQAARSTLAENYEEALNLFLEILEEDKNFQNDAVKKAMISIFSLLGDSHPLTKDYRKKLMMALY